MFAPNPIRALKARPRPAPLDWTKLVALLAITLCALTLCGCVSDVALDEVEVQRAELVSRLPVQPEDVVLDEVEVHVPPLLAHPEHDLTTETDHFFVESAPTSTIQTLVDAGARLTRIAVVTESPLSPLRFAATFVENGGDYARSGSRFIPGATDAELEELEHSTTERIVDFDTYDTAAGPRHAVALIGNTGSQFRSWALLRNQTLATLQSSVTTMSARVLSLHVATPARTRCFGNVWCFSLPAFYDAVVYVPEPADVRAQWLEELTQAEINRALHQSTTATPLAGRRGTGSLSRRVGDIVPSGSDGVFLVLLEERDAGHPYAWSFVDLVDTNEEDPDDLRHVERRLRSRYTALTPYQDGSTTRYAVAAVVAGQPVRAGTSLSGLQALDEAFEESARRIGAASAALAVSHQGRLIYARSYGLASFAPQLTAQPDHVYALASVSKAITASVVLHLIDEGYVVPQTGATLTLDTRVFRDVLIPASGLDRDAFDFDARLDDIRVRDLLEMRSGIQDGTVNGIRDADLTTFVRGVLKFEKDTANPLFSNAPGHGGKSHYLNFNYYVLTHLLDVIVGGETFMQLVDEVITDPLRLPRLAQVSTRSDEVKYYERPGPRNRKKFSNSTGTKGIPETGSGGFAASPIDLLYWARAVDRTTSEHWPLIRKETFDAIRTDSVGWQQGDLVESGFGFGFATSSTPSQPSHYTKGGFFPEIVNSRVEIRDDGYSFALVMVGDSVNKGFGFGSFTDSVRNELGKIVSAPVGDLFGSYGLQSDFSDRAWLGRSNRSFQSTTPTSQEQDATPLAGDFDGDGLTDIFWYRRGETSHELARGIGSARFETMPMPHDAGFTRPFIGDFDGNGRDDIFWYQPGTGLQDQIWWSANSFPITFEAQSWSVSSHYYPIVGNFDGGADDEIFWYRPGELSDHVWRFSGRVRSHNHSLRVGGARRPAVTDRNGDGFDDILFHGPGDEPDEWLMSSGDGSFDVVAEKVGGRYRPFGGDFDGDGYGDILWYGPGSGYDSVWWYGPSSRSTSSISVTHAFRPVIGQLDSSGASDILWYQPGTP